MLKGFDKDWNCNTNPSATYTNIDPGQYTFLVKASSSDGTWSDKPTELGITIHPAPWKTWWAMSLYCLAIALIMYFPFRLRLDRVRMQTQLKLELVSHERDRELIESKTQFFTNVSHEFRTPLSLILLPLETLMSSTQIPQWIKEKISLAHNSAEKMMSLVNELMDFNKAESGTMKLNLSKGDVASFVRDVTSLFHDLALKRNIRFSVLPESSSIYGLYDAQKLEKIIFNLLSNAFKFTSDGGEIKVLINEQQFLTDQSASRRCIEFVIIDNGIGIAASELPLVFDKFYQAKSASKIANPGTGIGLSLTKSLVKLHGGTITAESSDGETKFVIILPIENFSESEVSVQQKDEVLTKSHPVVTEDRGKDDKNEILLVEDNDELRTHLARELSTDYIVFEASNGIDGIRTALEKIPDLIISDILMASKNGLELCKTLKSDVKTSHIPIILLTAKASVDEQIIGIEAGADVYITKPFNYRYLLTHVRNIITSREKLYAHFSKDVYLLPSKVATNALDQAFLQRVIDHIVTHIQDTQLSVDSIAEVFNLSRVQVYRKVKALTGKSAVELIRSVRLKQALKLMESKKYTLAEIAYQTGFNSPSYFTRTFKEEYGKAPSEFLEAN
jgi:signal transduction histidine kinase/DNA-binding response OmpR family regulator